jgi:hypothetical protein
MITLCTNCFAIKVFISPHGLPNAPHTTLAVYILEDGDYNHYGRHRGVSSNVTKPYLTAINIYW